MIARLCLPWSFHSGVFQTPQGPGLQGERDHRGEGTFTCFSFHLCPPFSPIQGFLLFSLSSYVTAHCLLLPPSAFGLV